MKKIIIYTLLILGFIVIIGVFYINQINNFKQDGLFEISINEKPIEIKRDNNGIAYIFAENKADLFRGQGFVLAQDRLFQIEFYRALINGKAGEIVGNSMLQSDIKMRVLDLAGNAKRNFQYLDEETKSALGWYCEGYNAYLEVGENEFPVELDLLGMTPEPLKPFDIVAVTHFIGLFHSQNLEDEVLSLNLAAQLDNANNLYPLAINIDRSKPLPVEQDSLALDTLKSISKLIKEPKPLMPYPKLGSNNWAVSGEKTQSGKPILSNDPHVDARMLPGTFYPIGLFCPEFKAVGIATPAIPGILSGRNEFVSFGVTNGYGDSQDLFIEKTEGDLYYYKDKKVAFDTRQENIKVKDSNDVSITIRSTKNGPVISDFPVFNILTDDVVSLRWSLSETKSSSIGFDQMLETKNVAEARKVLHGMDNVFFNFALADVDGNIAHQATGLIPIRAQGNGRIPTIYPEENNWQGFIPKNELPNMVNPERQWIGTANNDTRPDDYPYYYSNHFSPIYRYQRMSELLSVDKKFNADDLWTMIFDVKNKQAEMLTPLFVKALSQDQNTKYLANILDNWDHKDAIESVGASVYNMLYNELLYLIMNDELPDEVENLYWENVYYWNQRIDQFIVENGNFIDDIKTPEKETLTELIIEAGKSTETILTERLGSNPDLWTWGKIHTIEFVSPIRSKGFGKNLLGAEKFPKAGSNQTLNRGAFVKNEDRQFDTSWFSSFRMVADMNDDEKIRGALSGGSSARIFHPYYKSQLEIWKNNNWIPYWLSKEKVIENTAHTLTLK